ncbi:unnamed protein product, partial [Mesorhabditis belari]|uniref:Lipase n=1 Tax=Mesorhabditis belari TaxID=2138241 RepID=A0AAF3EX84_9BILA
MLLILNIFVFLISFAFSFDDPLGPITKDFEEWLNRNGYAQYDFPRHDWGKVGSYGGKVDANQKLRFTPVIFMHGNSDGALRIPGPYSSGSSTQIAYFQSMGYTSAELYVTTWGNRSVPDSQFQAHNCSTIIHLRRFVEAVMGYTKSPTVNLAGHSMGVTLARKVAKGGKMVEKVDMSTCDIGKPLTDVVEVFLGICGANYGMCSCLLDTYTCNNINGFFPGASCGNNNADQCGAKPLPEKCIQDGYSQLLHDMNTDRVREGKKVYALWTSVDDIVAPNDLVWARYSSQFPTMDQQYIFTNLTHMQVKELTVDLQFRLLNPGGNMEKPFSQPFLTL